MIEKYPNEKTHVELPKSLKPNDMRNYSPQISHLDGYSQMPGIPVEPYKNNDIKLKRDFVTRKRS